MTNEQAENATKNEEIYSNFFEKLATPEEYRKGLFIEVNGQIRKLSQVPRSDGTFEETYIPWAKEALFRAYGGDFVKATIYPEMPKFDGEKLFPEHINFRPVVGRYLNSYHAIRWKPMPGPNWRNIETLLRHIFGVQFELGLDYFQLLYLQPTQKLPLLLLVSSENNTGKSTLCNFIKSIFGENVTGVNSESLRSRFSSTWINKLVVYVEEKLLDKDGDGELLKNLVTEMNGQSEAKGKDRVETEVFVKLIMTSNNENNPIVIHEDDTRVWAIKVPPFAPGKINPNFLEECEKEIPYFLYFLQNREISTQKEDRLWFRRDLVETDAWRKIVNYCRSSLEKQLSELLLTIMEECQVEELKYSLTDLLKLCEIEKIKVDRPSIKQLMKERWKVPGPVMNHYHRYMHDFSRSEGFSSTYVTGRFYTFQKTFIQKLTM